MKIHDNKQDFILYLDSEMKYSNFFNRAHSNSSTIYSINSIDTAKEIMKQRNIKVIIINNQILDHYNSNSLNEFLENSTKSVFITIGNTSEAEERYLLKHDIKVFFTFEQPLNEKRVSQILESAIELFNVKQEKQDLAELLQIEKQHALESDRLKASFLSNISHEIRTPLNGILGFSLLVEEHVADNKKIKEYNQIIEASCDRLLSVVDDMITTSMLHIGNINKKETIFDLVIFIQSILFHYTPMIKEKKLTLNLHGLKNKNDLIVFADKTNLHEVFKQLLNNAIKFTETGFINIGISMDKTPMFYVKDSGIGISKEKQKDIFKTFNQGSNEFVSRNYGGNGLGLSIVKGLIEMVNGKIWLESEKGIGTTVYFTYPLKIIEKEARK